MLCGVLSLALALLLVAPDDVTRSWEAPRGCPEAAEVARRVRALAGRVPGEGEVRVHARISGPPWSAEIELDRGGLKQTRTFSADTCDELANVVAVVVAVALDPVSVAVRVESDAGPRGPAEPPPTTLPTVPRKQTPTIALRLPAESDDVPTSAPAPRTTRVVPLRFALRIAGGGEIGATPRGTGGVEIAFAFTRGRFGLELQGRYWARRRSDVAAAASLRTELGTIGVRGCYVAPLSRVRLAGCVGLETGDYVVRAFEVPGGTTKHFPWLAATLGGGLSITLVEPVSLWLGIEGAANIFRPQAQLRTEPRTTLYQVAPAGLRALVGLELRLFGRPGRPGGRSAPP